MRFIISLGAIALIIFSCAKPLKRHPVPFYFAALALVALYLAGTAAGVCGGLWPYFMPLMQRCTLAFALFSTVMYVGVLSDSSQLRAKLMPIRRQLSILACIFALGHIAFYMQSYAPRGFAVLGGNQGLSLTLAVILIALMVTLLATSFQVVRRQMNAVSWKRIQRLSYPFYLFTYVHLALLLGPSALAGKDTAVVSLMVYSMVVATYVALRVRRALLRRTKHANTAPAS